MQDNRDPCALRDQRLVEGVVANLPLFWGVLPAHLAMLARQCWAMPAARGALVVERGTRPPGVYALAYGALKLVLRRREREERVLRLINARQTFGESSALLGRGSPYDAVALQESKLVVMPTASLLALIERDARFAHRLVTLLAENKLQLYAEMEAATLLRGEQRLASYLNELAGDGGAVQFPTVRLPFSKTLVASRLGMKKETLSRLLRDLASRRLIAVSRRDISILDRGGLTEIAARS